MSSKRESNATLLCKGKRIGGGRLNLPVGKRVIVELNAVGLPAPVHTSQLLSYLKTANHKPGLPVNFDVKLLKQGIVRLVL